MAAEQPSLEITEFAGLVTNRGDFGGPPGAAEEQDNIGVFSENELQVRKGLRPLRFDAT